MARGIEIPLSINPAKLIRGLRITERQLEDVGDELRDLERDGERAADGIERSMEDAADDTERAFRDLGRDVGDEFDRMERAARDTDLDVSDGVESAAGSAKQAAGLLAGEVVDEFVENWGEAVRSGDYASAVRETLSQLGQIGGIFGPAGAAIGGGLALAATTAFDAFMNTEGKQRITEATSDIFGDVEGAELSGREAAAAYARGFVEESDIGNQIQQALGTQDVAGAWQEVGRLARETGLEQTLVTEALLGQEQALGQIETAIQNNDVAYQQNRDSAGEVFGIDQDRYLQLEQQADVLGDQKAELVGLRDRTKEQLEANRVAAKVDKTRREVTKDIAGNTKDTKDNVANTKDKGLTRLQETLQGSEVAAEGAKEAVVTLPSGKTVRVNVDDFDAINRISNLTATETKTIRILTTQNQGPVNDAPARALTGVQR